MLVSSKLIFSTLISIGLLITTQAQAERYVSGNEIFSLIAGNTIHAKHLQHGYAYTVYFDHDGKTAYRKQGGGTTKTSYRIDGNQYCLTWNHKDQCAQIRDNGDGTFSHVNTQQRQVVQWFKVDDGKTIATNTRKRIGVEATPLVCDNTRL